MRETEGQYWVSVLLGMMSGTSATGEPSYKEADEWLKADRCRYPIKLKIDCRVGDDEISSFGKDNEIVEKTAEEIVALMRIVRVEILKPDKKGEPDVLYISNDYD